MKRGLGPPCPLLVPDQEFCFPLGAGPSVPQVSVSQVTLGVAGQSPHLSPGSALRFGRGCGVGVGGAWVPGGVSPLPCLPLRPLGEFLSRQLLLQVPVFCRPCGAGVGGPQGGSRPSVFLCLCRLLFHLHLVAVTEGIMWAPWWPSPAPLENSSRIWGHRGVPQLPSPAPYHP